MGIIVFPFYPPPPTYLQKKFCCGSEVICFHTSVWKWVLTKSAVTFDLLDRPARNFQGPLYSLQIIFGQVTRTTGPQGLPDPEKGVSAKSISSRYFGEGRLCHTFSKFGQWVKQNVGRLMLIFCRRSKKTGPEEGAGQGDNQNFVI